MTPEFECRLTHSLCYLSHEQVTVGVTRIKWKDLLMGNSQLVGKTMLGLMSPFSKSRASPTICIFLAGFLMPSLGTKVFGGYPKRRRLSAAQALAPFLFHTPTFPLWLQTYSMFRILPLFQCCVDLF